MDRPYAEVVIAHLVNAFHRPEADITAAMRRVGVNHMIGDHAIDLDRDIPCYLQDANLEIAVVALVGQAVVCCDDICDRVLANAVGVLLSYCHKAGLLVTAPV